MSKSPHRKQVWRVKLDKLRPAVVISRANTISSNKEVIVVPFSATIRLRPPAGVSCSAGTGGLPSDCVALCPLVKSVSKKIFKQCLGELPDREFSKILNGVQQAIHADEYSS